MIVATYTEVSAGKCTDTTLNLNSRVPFVPSKRHSKNGTKKSATKKVIINFFGVHFFSLFLEE